MIAFGTGGWRAIIGDTFIKTNIQQIAAALSKKMSDEGVKEEGIVIGYDRRFLSEQSAKWLIEVFAASGIKTYLIDKESPTPIIMYTVKSYNTPYGIAVTASHNPAEYNGIKMFTRYGRDSDVEVTNAVEEIIKAKEPYDVMDYEEACHKAMVEVIHPQNAYIDSVLNMLNVEAIREKELKILLDPMFGVSKTSLQTILISARCEVDVIHDRRDTMFGGRLPSPNAVTLSRLSQLVVEKKYDLGIGTDGDADRLGIIDELGAFIHPNKILVLLYYYLLEYKGWKGGVVRNLATTHLLDRIAKSYGELCYEVPVGFKHVSSKMAETNAIIGGESSGGLAVKGHVNGKDGIFAAGLLVEMISVTGKRLAAMLKDIEEMYGRTEMIEVNVTYHPDDREELLHLLFKEKKLPTYDEPMQQVNYMDGVKIYFGDDRWIIVRFSGTEPLMRIFCEDVSVKRAQEKVDYMYAFICNALPNVRIQKQDN